MSNITKIAFKRQTKIDAKPLYQYDYGQVLKFIDLSLPASYEVHFSNYERGEASVVLATSNEVAIPDVYLQSGRDIYVWIYLHTGDNDGETEYQITIPVIDRARPSNTEPDTVQQDVITQTIAALNSAVVESRAGVQSVLAVENNVTNMYNLVENSKDIVYQYKEDTEAAANQIRGIAGLGYITIGSTQLTEEQLQKLLLLIEED